MPTGWQEQRPVLLVRQHSMDEIADGGTSPALLPTSSGRRSFARGARTILTRLRLAFFSSTSNHHFRRNPIPLWRTRIGAQHSSAPPSDSRAGKPHSLGSPAATCRYRFVRQDAASTSSAFSPSSKQMRQSERDRLAN